MPQLGDQVPIVLRLPRLVNGVRPGCAYDTLRGFQEDREETYMARELPSKLVHRGLRAVEGDPIVTFDSRHPDSLTIKLTTLTGIYEFI